MISRLSFFIIVLLLLAILFWFVCGCTTAKKATNFMLTHPEVAAEFCAKEFPVKDSLIKGDSIILYDTLWGLSDPVIETVTKNDTVTITKTLPSKVITKTVHIRDTIIRENFARVSQLLNQVGDCNKMVIKKEEKITNLQEKLDEMRRKKNRFMWLFFVAVGAIGMFTFLKIKKIL